jgi:hypothetical protein
VLKGKGVAAHGSGLMATNYMESFLAPQGNSLHDWVFYALVCCHPLRTLKSSTFFTLFALAIALRFWSSCPILIIHLWSISRLPTFVKSRHRCRHVLRTYIPAHCSLASCYIPQPRHSLHTSALSNQIRCYLTGRYSSLLTQPLLQNHAVSSSRRSYGPHVLKLVPVLKRSPLCPCSDDVRPQLYVSSSSLVLTYFSDFISQKPSHGSKQCVSPRRCSTSTC